MNSAHAKRPSLAKTRAPGLIEQKAVFFRTTEGRWRELFARADTMSEGAVKAEGDARAWFGSTSLVVGLPVDMSVDERAFVRAVAEKDVHVRVHALRCALREAQCRAPGLLGRMSCDVTFHVDPRGLRIDVDVQAPLIERRTASRIVP